MKNVMSRLPPLGDGDSVPVIDTSSGANGSLPQTTFGGRHALRLAGLPPDISVVHNQGPRLAVCAMSHIHMRVMLLP